MCNGGYGFDGALVLHVGRQRGDKNPVSQCIAAAVATTAAATAAAVNGGVVRRAGGARVGGKRVGESGSFLRFAPEVVEERDRSDDLRGRAERCFSKAEQLLPLLLLLMMSHLLVVSFYLLLI